MTMFSKLILGLAALTLASYEVPLRSAHAEPHQVLSPTWTKNANGSSYLANALPPLQYDHPFDGNIEIIIYNNSEELKAAGCSGANPGACARVWAPRLVGGARWCVIKKLPDPMLRATFQPPDIVMRHEIGHCNSWPGDHEGARPYYPTIKELKRIIAEGKK